MSLAGETDNEESMENADDEDKSEEDSLAPKSGFALLQAEEDSEHDGEDNDFRSRFLNAHSPSQYITFIHYVAMSFVDADKDAEADAENTSFAGGDDTEGMRLMKSMSDRNS